MVLSTRGRPRYAALSGCTNATMLSKEILLGQKILYFEIPTCADLSAFSSGMPIASLPGQKILFTLFIPCAIYIPILILIIIFRFLFIHFRRGYFIFVNRFYYRNQDGPFFIIRFISWGCSQLSVFFIFGFIY